jgi:hypothetical protein
MGSLYEAVRRSGRLVSEPTVTRVDDLIVASVSNWGAYGLVAALSRQQSEDLLPTDDEAAVAITSIVDLGAVDGITGKTDYSVDGFTMGENQQKLARLRAIAMARHRSSSPLPPL